MPHAAHSSPGRGIHAPDPQTTNAYLVGGGIASLAAAVFLIRDAHVPASQIHILESSPLSGGSMDGAGSPETGYVLRGGRMLNLSYVCLYDLLESVPSLRDHDVTVLDEIRMFNAVKGNKTHSNARLVVERRRVPGSAEELCDPIIAEVRDYGLSGKERVDLVRMMVEGEDRLGDMKIEDYFDQTFFKTNFWYMWATTFAFQSWHSAVEFRRYLHRFIQEFPRLNTLAGVDRTPYNQYDSIILPITKYLQHQGVDFKYGNIPISYFHLGTYLLESVLHHSFRSALSSTTTDTTVRSLSYGAADHITVEQIHILEAGNTGIIHVHPDNDIVAITLGSMTSSSSLGSNTAAPSLLPPGLTKSSPDGAWALWDSLSRNSNHFGRPLNFSTRVAESHWESFTVTLKTPEFLERLETFSGNKAGTGALVTFRDSNWLMSIVVPHQPHFLDQPDDVQVFWGYGLFPARRGNFVDKPMALCSGADILTELLGHLRFPPDAILASAITIPCSMPYITAQFLTRRPGDRPAVIPHGSTNLAFIGQFVEIPHDVVFTVEYSVRGALMAVTGLMGLDKPVRGVFKGDRDLKVLAKALNCMIEDGPGGLEIDACTEHDPWLSGVNMM
ncbi:hypothetical protein MMC19_000133 [Ptychographa xylographoides]|nr:hypothetical protein [Ptychographa xylographoides]